LHKKLSHDLQFDVNYTYSHSIDNVSSPANNVFGSSNFSGGLVCSITDLSACRGNSDFDATHIISGNFIYTLPFGRGKTFVSGASGWVNQIIGGWQLSGVPSWRSGFAFTTVSNAFPVSFANNTPGIFIGTSADLKNNVHFDPARGFVLFADPDRTRAAFRGPLGLEDGTRNNLRGPGFTNFDLGLAKHFFVKERLDIEFRMDAYNAFNHVNFGLPGTGGSGGTADISDPSSFGVINNAGRPREVQFALRVAQSRGRVSDADIAALRLAGFDEASVIEIVANVAVNVLTNICAATSSLTSSGTGISDWTGAAILELQAPLTGKKATRVPT